MDLVNSNETKRKNCLNKSLVLFLRNIVTAKTITSMPMIFVISAGKVKETPDKFYKPEFITVKAHFSKWSRYWIRLQVRPYKPSSIRLYYDYCSRTAPILELSSGAPACEHLRFEGRGCKSELAKTKNITLPFYNLLWLLPDLFAISG